MNVASLELCKELYELSGWETADFAYPTGHQPERDYPYFRPLKGLGPLCGDTPAYTLDYLLRKVRTVETEGGIYGRDLYNVVVTGMKNTYFATLDSIATGSRRGFEFVDVEPENAVARLFIEMFKQGILERD